MAPKKHQKQKKMNDNDCVILKNNKTSSHQVIERIHLLYDKKDDLKVGTQAKFNGAGDTSLGFSGTIVMMGTRKQCDTSISLIRKTNKNNCKNDKQRVESDSESSNHLIIDEQAEEGENDNDNQENSESECESTTNPPASKQQVAVNNATNSTTMKSTTTSAANHSPSPPPPATTSSSSTVLKETSNINVTNKRKDAPDGLSSTTNAKKHSTKISQADYDRLKKKTERLEKEVEMYKSNWMPRPSGATAAYFIDVGKILSGASYDEDGDEDKETKLEKIIHILDMDASELRSCEHDTDITKTCRQIVKYVYKDSKERAKMAISTMNADVLKCIQEYARMVHPAQSKFANCVLNNAIGNVFSTDKRKRGRNDSSSGIEDNIDDDENSE